MPRKFALMEAAVGLAKRERLTYREACARLGRGGAENRRAKNRRIAGAREDLERRKLA